MKYLNLAIGYLKAHWVAVVALSMAIWDYAAPTVKQFVATHPHASFWYGLIAVVVAFYLKSPFSPVPPITPASK
jgi:hypothetical protein